MTLVLNSGLFDLDVELVSFGFRHVGLDLVLDLVFVGLDFVYDSRIFGVDLRTFVLSFVLDLALLGLDLDRFCPDVSLVGLGFRLLVLT